MKGIWPISFLSGLSSNGPSDLPQWPPGRNRTNRFSFRYAFLACNRTLRVYVRPEFSQDTIDSRVIK